MRRPPIRIAALAVIFAAACAGERDPINRVQPWALDKTFFVGPDGLVGTSDDPEFWAQGTLVDVGYGASQDGLFTSTYAQPLTRIKWDIKEDQLLARLTYELIDGSDGRGAGPASTDGQVVAAYRIESHFDIKRDYNSSTGEEINVVSENTVDRPWHERTHMRVDWSKNLFTDAYELDTLSQLGVYGSIDYEPVSYTVTDPTHPDSLNFAIEDGYFDVTNKVFARPKMIDLRRFGWGIDEFPACWLDNDFMSGTAPSGNCNPVELTLRQSYRKVVDTDYEPADWDGYRFQAYGAFTNERKGYARNYGMSDDLWRRFINRYDIWENSHYYTDPVARTGAVECYTPTTTPRGKDPNRDENNNGTADECEAVGRGSVCDQFKQKCTLPYRDRTETTIPWYYAAGSNPEYFESSEWATHEWDVAMRHSVVAARYTECKKTGGENCETLYPVYNGQIDSHTDAVRLAREVDDCRNGIGVNAGKDCNRLADTLGGMWGVEPGVVALAKLPEMIVLCHSPVEKNDHPACGSSRLPANVTAEQCAAKDVSGELAETCRSALNVRRGDLRYHQIVVVTEPQTPSPWGIMVDSVDPLTGEKVAASINVWSHVTDLWTQGIIDMARYVKGELKTEDVTEGTYISEWARAAEAATTGGLAGQMTKEEFDERIAGFLGVDKEHLEESKEFWNRIDPSLKAKLKKVEHEARSVRADAKVTPTTKATYDARRNRARGTDLEAALSTKAMQQLAGVSGREGIEEFTGRVSPFRMNDLRVMNEMQKQRDLRLAERGACIMRESPLPTGIAALADVLEEKFGAFNPTDSKEVQAERAERMRKWLAQRSHYAVMAHEMGHSIGLRHNFVSSSDSFNYRPQYWQLRTDNGQKTNACTSLDPSGENCVGPRYLDPVNMNERSNLQWMFMQSSVMDYAGEPTQDLVGLGAYDYAATRMFYGESVAVYEDNTFKSSQPRGVGVLEKMDGFGGILGFQYVVGSPGGNLDIHYSQLNKEYQLIKDCVQVDPYLFKPSNWNTERDGEWHPVVDGLIVSVDGKYSRCKTQPVDYVQWSSMKSTGTDFSFKSNSVDGSGRTRVPYGFATDNWADLGNLSVYRHDNGADPYELFDFLITQQEVNHIFDNYRRGRMSFSVRSAAGRTLGRYNEKMRDAAKGLGLLVNIYKDFALEIGYEFESLWPVIAQSSFAPNILASSIAFDHFARQLQRPQAGEHYLENGVLLSEDDAYADHSDQRALTIPNGATGYMQNVGFGGKPLENALADDKGEYDSMYTLWAGSYYDKAYTSMLFTESVDNFISSSRSDFLDARFRAVSLADVFPEGYRRWLANNLTGDTFTKGARVASTAAGVPLKDAAGYPASGIGWTSWWPATGPRTCFHGASSIECSSSPANTVPVDPQVGWEQQKFLIAWTLMFLPENEQQHWLNMMNLWEIGADNDPGFSNRIELHDPNGRRYVAKTFGTEQIFGKTVQKGISARMLEYANSLLKDAYETTPGPLDNNGQPLWYVPVYKADGTPKVKYDPSVEALDNLGRPIPGGRVGCNATDSSACVCSSNRACVAFNRFTELPFFMRQAMRDYGLADPSMRGIY